MKIIGIVKGLLLFVYIICEIKADGRKLHSIFFLILQKSKDNFFHNNEQTLHTLENTGFKTNQFGLVKEYIWG